MSTPTEQPVERLRDKFEEWWKDEGKALMPLGEADERCRTIKCIARITWLLGADAAYGEFREHLETKTP